MKKPKIQHKITRVKIWIQEQEQAGHHPVVLCLTLHRQWFLMVLAGIKRDEYREITDRWRKILFARQYTHIHFRNGYAENLPEALFEIDGSILEGIGRPEWGANTSATFIIPIGKEVWRKA